MQTHTLRVVRGPKGIREYVSGLYRSYIIVTSRKIQAQDSPQMASSGTGHWETYRGFSQLYKRWPYRISSNHFPPERGDGVNNSC